MMPEQPCRHDVRADSWTRGNENGGRHLNDPDEQHERVTRDRKQPLDRRSEILIPVREEVRELVESRQKRALR